MTSSTDQDGSLVTLPIAAAVILGGIGFPVLPEAAGTTGAGSGTEG